MFLSYIHLPLHPPVIAPTWRWRPQRIRCLGISGSQNSVLGLSVLNLGLDLSYPACLMNLIQERENSLAASCFLAPPSGGSRYADKSLIIWEVVAKIGKEVLLFVSRQPCPAWLNLCTHSICLEPLCNSTPVQTFWGQILRSNPFPSMQPQPLSSHSVYQPLPS